MWTVLDCIWRPFLLLCDRTSCAHDLDGHLVPVSESLSSAEAALWSSAWEQREETEESVLPPFPVPPGVSESSHSFFWAGCWGKEVILLEWKAEFRRRVLHSDTNVWLTHSSPVLPGDVSGLHSSVDSTQTCFQPTIGRSKMIYNMYKYSISSIEHTPAWVNIY